MIRVNVQNGTDAGCRRVKPTPKTWRCECDVRDPVDNTMHKVIQASWISSCVRCGTRRPS